MLDNLWCKVGLASLALACVFAAAGQASADFHWIAGKEPDNGDILEIKYNNYENLLAAPAVGQNLYGVGYITTISNYSKGNQPIWQELSTDGGELTVVFNNFTVGAVINAAPGVDGEIFFTGGDVDVFWDSSPDRGAPLVGTNAQPDGSVGGTFSDGQLWVSLDGSKRTET